MNAFVVILGSIVGYICVAGTLDTVKSKIMNGGR